MNTPLLYGETQRPEPLPPALRGESTGLTARQMMICLAVCMGLQMTGFVMILPLFARRFTELGAGVAALGVSEMAYALAATLAAPFMGAASDRFGRRPVVLGSLAVYALAFIGYLLAPSALIFILLRGTAGAFTAGLMPAATGMIADLAPEDRRAQWIGILSAGASFGWIAGPMLGGFLYDRWGYAAALLVSIGMAGLAFLMAMIGIHDSPETPGPCAGTQGPGASVSRDKRKFLTIQAPPDLRDVRAALRPLMVAFITYFAVMFAWAFIEPRLMFYAYDDLGWSSSMLGLVMSTYGIAMMLGELGLGRLSDELGRKPVIVAGLLLFSAQFLGLALFRDYVPIVAAFVIAGLGNALFDPALSAAILDAAPAEHQARILGLKSTFGSIGNILGPALVVLVATQLEARGVFLAATGFVFLVALMAVASRGSQFTGYEQE